MMKFFGKTLGLLLASLTLASCGGGGGNGGALSPPQSSTITLHATTTTLPLNTAGIDPAVRGAPTQAEVTIDWRNPDGSYVNGHDIAVSISPITVAAISCLATGSGGAGSGSTSVCGTTSDLYGSVPITGINGQATVFVNSRLTAGTANLLVTATDPATGRTVNANIVFTVTSGVGPAPANVALVPSPAGIYLPNSGGNNTSSIAATVTDGGGQLIADPVTGNTGVDNIQFEIVGSAGDAVLSTNSVAGPVQNTTVTSHTVHGVATVSLQAGNNTPQGAVQIRATVDRADNNVSNGIQDPVSQTTSVIVSDGKLFSVEITSPIFSPALPGLTINSLPTSDQTTPPADGTIPPNPDATMSLVVTAKASDRQGNPVLPGTAIHFGEVDEPVSDFDPTSGQFFELSGLDGDPQVGGTLFTAPTGQFRTAGGGAGPGDALLVLGKSVVGYADLENVVTVRTVNSQTSLTSATPFNLNDTTGASVPATPILPYLIGRSGHGNSITATATTDDNGIAHASLTYTINTVSNPVALWATGAGPNATDVNHQVTDIVLLTYPGLAPASIVASPNPIIGDKANETVTICVTDALDLPLRGVPVAFAFSGLGASGNGSVDGQASSGVLSHFTDANGCVDASVTTSGLSATVVGDDGSGNSGQLTFSAAGQSTAIDIVVQVATLQVRPSSVSVLAAGSTTTITITALTADGVPVPGAPITGTCAASGGSLAPAGFTGTTDAGGQTTDVVTASGFVTPGTPPTVGSGTCTFSTPGSRSATVTFSGRSTCNDFSPPSCPNS